ncbi:MAG: CheR family methyltransferase [Planctomycetaceae bacterium]
MVSAADFACIREFLRRRSGVVIDPSKGYLVEARLLPVVRQHRYTGLEALVGRLRQGGDAVLERDVLNAMMTHETSFFRDKSPFETVKQILPGILERRAVSRHLTLWSAAASTGQEAYSLAMLLEEHFRERLAGWRVRILATDISDVVLSRAREGSYSELEVSRGLPAEYRQKYFVPLRGRWSIAQECRKRVEFRPFNLAGPWQGIPTCDIVFLRNVLIYFDLPTRAAIIERMRAVIRPDGRLFIGGAETLLGVSDAFERVEGVGCSSYRPRPLAGGRSPT